MALPKRDTGEDSAVLVEYLKDPTPGVVLVFDCWRYEFDGDDKAKLDRVRRKMLQVTAGKRIGFGANG